MPEVFNLPTKEQFDLMNQHLGKIANTRVQEDYSNAPGGKFLLAGDKNAGFFGFVPASDLITGDQLALDVGISAGTSQFSDTPWIKYIYKARICFIPVKTIRRSVPWNAIYEAGAVYASNDEGTLPPNGRIGTQLSISASDNSINTTGGDFKGDKSAEMDYADTVAAVGDTVVLKGWANSANNGEFTVSSITDNKIVLSGGTLVTESGNKNGRIYPKANAVTQNKVVTINGLKYRVRLMRGAASDPTDSYANSDRGSIGPDNEWNAIILPLHEHAKLQNWNYPTYAGTTEDWGVYLTDADLITHHTFDSGNYTWCQETRDDAQTYRRVDRGHLGASTLYANYSWSVHPTYGWRPVLELLG
jgi:hypothetical protein